MRMNATSGCINMKKQIISLIVVPLLLTSCNAGNLSLNQMKEKMNNVSDENLYPMYKVVGAIDFNNQYMDVEATFSKDPEPGTFVPYARYNDGFYLDSLDNSESEENVIIKSMASRSYWLRAPLRLHKSNFYDEVEGIENTTCGHYIIQHLITSYVGLTGATNPSRNQMKMKVNKDGDFIFYGEAVHTKVTIDNFPYYPDFEQYPELGGEWDEGHPLPCYYNVVNAKVNISFRYNKDGWLVEEKMTSVGYNYYVASTSQVALQANYGYFFGS